MFTDDDLAFLNRLGARSEARLAGLDASKDQLHAAISAVRGLLVTASVDVSSRDVDEVNGLLDAVWWAVCAGEGARAREHAARLAHAVRDLSLPGLQAMRLVDAAQRIRSLVVLAA
jgi:hypothetical protein